MKSDTESERGPFGTYLAVVGTSFAAIGWELTSGLGWLSRIAVASLIAWIATMLFTVLYRKSHPMDTNSPD
jgi:hypothetical protein